MNWMLFAFEWLPDLLLNDTSRITLYLAVVYSYVFRLYGISLSRKRYLSYLSYCQLIIRRPNIITVRYGWGTDFCCCSVSPHGFSLAFSFLCARRMVFFFCHRPIEESCSFIVYLSFSNPPQVMDCRCPRRSAPSPFSSTLLND